MATCWTAANIGPDVRDYPAASLAPDAKAVVDRFHGIYYGAETAHPDNRTYRVTWLGYEMFKCPLDLWIYQEIITKQKPRFVVETGTYRGGSALYLASLFDLIGHGEVITIDVDATGAAQRPQHPRITYLTGSSIDPQIVAQVRTRLGPHPAMVILDSDHRRDHVLAELRAYHPLVAPGGYLIVEDTNVNGHPAYPSFGPGPWEAVDDFLRETPAFQPDPACERLLMTMNPRGFLRRR
jgi:cephalosporin hydroxylase